MILSTETGALRKCVGEQKTIEILAKAGFDALDYTFTPAMEHGDSPWLKDDYKDYAKKVNKMAKDNGVYFNQAHAPFVFQEIYLPEIKKKILPLQIRCLESCALLGIPHAIIHPIHSIPYPKNKEYIWKINNEYYHILQQYAEQFGVKISLENMFWRDKRRGCICTDMFGDPYEYAEFYDQLNDKENFNCCVDTGHCGLVGDDAGNVIRVLGSRVQALHINDNRYRDDDHLIPFQGLIDWDDVMKALAEIHYSGDLTFEALHLYEGLDEDFYAVEAKYLHDVGRYLIHKFEKYSRDLESDKK